MKILLIDNYDSFVYNLYQYFDEAGCDVIVERNDKVDLDKVDSYDALILSPGPGIPKDAGLLKEIITRFKTKPMLGICLGMQAIGEVFDGQLDLLEKPLHGFSKEIEHYNNPIFNEVPKLYTVGRYHSWVVNENSLNSKFEILSRDKDGQLMGIKHQNYPMYGFQFHPESVLTNNGRQLIKNFLKEVKTCN
jgi:anthranilate synthase/aminodeoxychorismate synthase-like glutamine amidotransferase